MRFMGTRTSVLDPWIVVGAFLAVDWDTLVAAGAVAGADDGALVGALTGALTSS
jgi:hypothetical protein